MPVGATMETDQEVVVSVKGRLRKPSAKALAAAEATSTSSGTLPLVLTPSRSSSRRQPVLSLQFAVAESVVNDEEELVLDAREEAVTIETVSVSEWRARGFAKPIAPKKQQVIVEPEQVPMTVAETTGSEAGGSDELQSPKQAPAEEPDMDTHSEDSAAVRQQQVEVKRKRGRPFKGQEKPIEERLMVETSKIRRLIDDVIRKGDSSEFFTRLRKIASDLDSVMALMPVGDRPHGDNLLPQPIDEAGDNQE